MPKSTPGKPALTRRERRAAAHTHSDRSPAPVKGPADFSAPHEVSRAEGVFGGRDVFSLMPAYKDIPPEFKSTSNPFCRIQAAWFFLGFKKWPLEPKRGIDLGGAIAHLSAIQASFEPPHEHKAAGAAYLMSLWFEPPKG